MIRVSLFQLLPIALIGFTIGRYLIPYESNSSTPIQNQCTADSLQTVIYNLQGEQEMRNKIRDEEVENLKILVSKYEFGLSGLDKANRKEFIRYAMFSEDYSEKVNEDYFEENRKIKQKAGYANIK